MSKTERMFPLNTLGGRIQNRRINILKKTRPEFYDLVRPGEKIGNDSKSRTIKNWESGDTIPDIDTIKKICTILNCSSDYLLGLDNCSSKNIQFINEETGLSEKNIVELQLAKYTPEIINSLNKMFDFGLLDIAISLSLGEKSLQDYQLRKEILMSIDFKKEPSLHLETGQNMTSALNSAKINVLQAQSRFSKILEKIIPIKE